MDTERPLSRDVVSVAGWCLANLVLLMVVALTLADRRDDEALNSATPVVDGALIALTSALSLVLANGVLLCLAPRTRRLGIGMLLAAALAVPAGILIILGFLSTELY